MAGRKRTSVEEKKLRGTLQPSRVNPRMPKAASSTPHPPAYLCGAGKRAFRQLVGRLTVEQRASASHTELIGLAASRMVEVAELARQVREEGRTYVTENEFGSITRAHPAVAMLDRAKKDLRTCLAELGLTPASISKVGGGEGASAESDFEQFLQ